MAIVDRDEGGAAAVAKEIESDGGRAWALGVDLADPEATAAAVNSVLDLGGRVDILINSAGVTGGRVSLVDMDVDTWDLVQAVNVRAPMILMQRVGRHMIERGGGGRIVSLSSSAAFRATSSPIHYAASKAAISSMTRTIAAELGPHGINVNAVAPGLTKTPMTKGVGDEAAFDAAVKDGPLANLLHRAAEAADVAEVIVFLCLPGSRQITAQTVHTSAGLVL